MARSVILAIGMIGIVHADNDSYSLLNSWTGFYAGVDSGFIFNNAQLRSQQLGFTYPSETCNTSSNFLTLSPGIQLGYLYQFPNSLVSGIEADVTFNSNQKDTLSCNSNINPNVYDRFIFKNQMESSIKGRVGRALNWNKKTLLPYLTAGASFANVGLTYKNEGGDYYSKNTTHAGWLIGTGIEWAFMQHWSARIEYSYVEYGNVIHMEIPSVYGLLDPNGNGRVDLSSNNIVVALNFRV